VGVGVMVWEEVVVQVVALVVVVFVWVVLWWVVEELWLFGYVLAVGSFVACQVAWRENLVGGCWCWMGVWHEFELG
jgi:hypothetical protein